MCRSSREAIEQELDAVGVPYRVTSSKHVKFYIQHADREHLLVCSKTDSDGRGSQNARAGVRRLLRQLGLLADRSRLG